MLFVFWNAYEISVFNLLITTVSVISLKFSGKPYSCAENSNENAKIIEKM